LTASAPSSSVPALLSRAGVLIAAIAAVALHSPSEAAAETGQPIEGDQVPCDFNSTTSAPDCAGVGVPCVDPRIPCDHSGGGGGGGGGATTTVATCTEVLTYGPGFSGSCPRDAFGEPQAPIFAALGSLYDQGGCQTVGDTFVLEYVREASTERALYVLRGWGYKGVGGELCGYIEGTV
jgi:hypothetical protein